MTPPAHVPAPTALPTITFYVDFVSPYAWLAFTQLPQVLEGLHYAVRYRPVLLGALLQAQNNPGPAGVAPKRAWTLRHAAWLGQHLGDALLRNGAVEAGGQHPASGTVFQTIEHLTQDAKRRGHHTRGIARVHAFGEDLHFQCAAGHAAQAGRQPQLVVIARAAVQANHQRHIAQTGLEHVDVRQQVARAAFLAGFNQTDDARMRDVLRLQCLNGGDAGVNRIAIVGAPSAIEPVAFQHRRPRPQVAAPAVELRLLVQVAVHQHCGAAGSIGVGLGALHFKKQQRRAPRQAHDC
jgi:hypothetical protein